MNRTIFIRLSALLLSLAGAWTAYTFQGKGGAKGKQEKQPPAPLNLIKVADDLYMIEGSGGNVAIYTTDEGVILVDDKFDQNFDEIMANVKKVTSQQVKYVINTHHHGDHSGSNAKMLPIAEVIAHKNARDQMVKAKQPGLQRIVFADQLELNLGGKQVMARYFGRGHTNGDIVVFFPARRTIHAGDLFAGASPLIDYPNGGSLIEWPKTLEGVLKEDWDTVIPGHGAVQKKADLVTYRNNIDKLRTRVSGLVREGKSKDEVSAILTAEFNWSALQKQMGLDGIVVELK